MFSWTRRLWIPKLPRSWRQGLPTSRRLKPPATSGEHLPRSGSQHVRKVTKLSLFHKIDYKHQPKPIALTKGQSTYKKLEKMNNPPCAMVKQQMIAHVQRQYLVGINRDIFVKLQTRPKHTLHNILLNRKNTKWQPFWGGKSAETMAPMAHMANKSYHVWQLNLIDGPSSYWRPAQDRGLQLWPKEKSDDPLLLVDVGCILPGDPHTNGLKNDDMLKFDDSESLCSSFIPQCPCL